MEKNLERLGKLLKVAGDSKEVRWNDPLTCSGMIYGYAADGLGEGVDVVTTIKESMLTVCDGGLQCDQCKVYNALQLFISDVEVLPGIKDTLSLMGLREDQLTVLMSALDSHIELLWNAVESLEEEDVVENYRMIRAAEELHKVIEEYFKDGWKR
jgi:hypothetical protein